MKLAKSPIASITHSLPRAMNQPSIDVHLSVTFHENCSYYENFSYEIFI